MPKTMPDGEMTTKDPNDTRVFTFDWGTLNLPVGVSIPSVSVFTISVVSGPNTTPLTKDQEVILAGNRKTQLRLAAGTLGTVYQIDNQIVTDEAPSQTLNRRFQLLVEDR